eukprot:s185_g22.t1
MASNSRSRISTAVSKLAMALSLLHFLRCATGALRVRQKASEHLPQRFIALLLAELDDRGPESPPPPTGFTLDEAKRLQSQESKVEERGCSKRKQPPIATMAWRRRHDLGTAG